MWSVKLSKRATKDKAQLKGAGLDKIAKQLLGVLMSNPFQNPPSCEKLVGGPLRLLLSADQ
jgi:hypothetical protein